MLPTCQFSFNPESNTLNNKHDQGRQIFKNKVENYSSLLLYKTANHLSLILVDEAHVFHRPLQETGLQNTWKSCVCILV